MCDEYTLHSEADIFPKGLPDLDCIKAKKRKSEFEKTICIDEAVDPCPTPLDEYQLKKPNLSTCTCKNTKPN